MALQTFLMSKRDIYLEDWGKIYKQINKFGIGDETVPYGAILSVHYTATLEDGTKFDSSRDRGAPFKFRVGVGEVIPGWDIAVQTMKKEEQAILTIRPKYAFGSLGNLPTIPPDATLLFDVEILGWEEYEDVSFSKCGGALMKKLMKEGTGYLSPDRHAYVEVYVRIWFKRKIIWTKEVIVKLLDAIGEDIPREIRDAMQDFKMGEHAQIVMAARLAFETIFYKELELDGSFDTILFDIKLIRFEKLSEPWTADEDYKMEMADMFKRKGNLHIESAKRGRWEMAIEMYQKALKNLIGKDGEPIKSDEECMKLLLSLYLNLALCNLKIDKYEKARDAAFKALEIDPDNEKGHYRYGMALQRLNQHEEASSHFIICLRIDPRNSKAGVFLSQCKENIKKKADAEKKLYGNMFGRKDVDKC